MKIPSEDASSEEWKEYGDALKRGDHLWKPSLRDRIEDFVDLWLLRIFSIMSLVVMFTIVMGILAWALRQIGVL